MKLNREISAKVHDGCLVLTKITDSYNGEAFSIWIERKHFDKLKTLMDSAATGTIRCRACGKPKPHAAKTQGIYGAKVRDIALEKRYYAKPKATRGKPIGVVTSTQIWF